MERERDREKIKLTGVFNVLQHASSTHLTQVFGVCETQHSVRYSNTDLFGVCERVSGDIDDLQVAFLLDRQW